MARFIKGNKYNIEVNGKTKECIYCGYECGDCVFEIAGTTLLVFKKWSDLKK